MQPASEILMHIVLPGERVRKLSDNTLRMEAVRREDAGTYVCHAQIKGRTITKQLAISVVVNGEQPGFPLFFARVALSLNIVEPELPPAAPPKVRLREEVKKVMAGSETNVTFVCLVDGLPKPNITWTM